MPDPALLLQVCPNDNPPFGDICRYYQAAAAALGWETLTVMLEPRAPTPDPAFHYLGRDLSRQLGDRLRGRRPALTLCHRYRAYRAVSASGLAQAPLVVVAHEYGLLTPRRRRLRLRADALMRRPGPRFAGVSRAVSDELAHWCGHAELLPNGLDLARCDAGRLTPDQAREALALPAAGFHIGVVGRLHPKKDPLLAVAGFRAALTRRRPGAPEPDAGMRLTLLGDGPLKPQVAAAAAGLPVDVKGFVADAARCMAAFDLLLLPSGDREAFGMVALEAMAAGVPVLCGPAPGPRFVLGDTGLQFDPHTADALADALVAARAAAATGALAELARRARLRVEQTFSVDAGARRLAALAAGQSPVER
ncbi:MAG: hypothetical protein CMD39_07200 [Gammaproteobacteria bacterium]|nr:hypothetical protein [Gammaproteobacteria bacterium]